MRHRRRRQAVAALLAGSCAAPALTAAEGPAGAVIELRLDRIEATVQTGMTKLRVESRAKFRFDPATSTLTADGSFVAQHVLGPAQVSRLSHRFEDLKLTPGARPAARSYECLEGSFGASVGANICGNYLFGPNGLDDGGYGDDIHQGPPKSLDDFEVSACDWNGTKLVVTLAAVTEGPDVYPERRLTLEFSASGKTATER